MLEKYEKGRQRVYDGEPWKEVFWPVAAKNEKMLENRREIEIKTRELLKKLGEENYAHEESEPPKRFRLEEGSNLTIMPKNTHISYIIAGREIAERILSLGANNLAEDYIGKVAQGYFNHFSQT